MALRLSYEWLLQGPGTGATRLLFLVPESRARSQAGGDPREPFRSFALSPLPNGVCSSHFGGRSSVREEPLQRWHKATPSNPEMDLVCPRGWGWIKENQVGQESVG